MRRFFLVFVLMLLTLASAIVRADDDVTGREASKHFQRGVELYNDGDFRGALVEFRRAYGLLPRSNVLYDIGETEYQLQDYAAALRTMERFLAETGQNAAHRSEVEETVEILRSRVGRIVLTVDTPGCDVAIDDQPAGTTPLGHALLVSVGTRRIAVACVGHPPVSRRADVAAGEVVRMEIKVPALQAAAAAPLLGPTNDLDHKRRSHQNVVTAWTVTAALAAATIGVYVGAFIESNDLKDLKKMFPVTQDRLDHQATITNDLAITGDILAAATVVSAGISTYLMLTSTPAPQEDRKVHVGLSWNGVFFHGKF